MMTLHLTLAINNWYIFLLSFLNAYTAVRTSAMAIVCKKVIKANVSPALSAVVHQPQPRRFVDELVHIPRLSAHPITAALCHVVPNNCVVNKEFHSLSIRTATTSYQKAYDCSINQELGRGQWALGSISLNSSSSIFGCRSVFIGSDPIISSVVWRRKWFSYVWIVTVGWLVSESIAGLGPVLKGLSAFFKGEYCRQTNYSFWQVHMWGVS